MPLYPASIPTPWTIISLPDVAGASYNTLTANQVYLVGIVLYGPAVLTGLRVRFDVAGNGNYDVGLYDSVNRLAHAGAQATAAGSRTTTLGTAINLAPGRYWLAFWIDNATDTVFTESCPTGVAPIQGGSATSLPSTLAGITGIANNDVMPYIAALLQGGWS